MYIKYIKLNFNNVTAKKRNTNMGHVTDRLETCLFLVSFTLFTSLFFF